MSCTEGGGVGRGGGGVEGKAQEEMCVNDCRSIEVKSKIYLQIQNSVLHICMIQSPSHNHIVTVCVCVCASVRACLCICVISHSEERIGNDRDTTLPLSQQLYHHKY